jgi:hypothetical protein
MSDSIDRHGSLIRQLQGAGVELADTVTQLQGELFDALDGKAVRGGSDEVTFSGANSSAVKTVPHGLGAVPAAAVVTSGEGTGVNFQVTKDATNIYVQGDYPYGTLSQTITFDWIAIG